MVLIIVGQCLNSYFQPSEYFTSTLHPFDEELLTSAGWPTVAGAPLVDEKHSLLLVRVFSPIWMLKRGRWEEKAKDMGRQEEKLQKESGWPKPFQSVYRLTVCKQDCRVRWEVCRDPKLSRHCRNLQLLLTIAPELHFLVFSYILPFFSVSFFNISLVENLGNIPVTLGWIHMRQERNDPKEERL